MNDDPNARAEALHRRLEAAKARGDAERPRLARLHVERALIAEEQGDRAGALAAFTAAADANPEHLAAVREARRGSDDPHERLAWIDRELRLIGDAERADLLIERARALEASGAAVEDVVRAWQAARAQDPEHDGALVGLERALARAGDDAELAIHHARLARTITRDPALAASHLLSRGRILEMAGDDAAAQEAYAEAVAAQAAPELAAQAAPELAAQAAPELGAHAAPGPAREALARVLSRRGCFAELRDLRVEDAERTADRGTRVRRLYEAARLSADRLDDPERAIALLQRAGEHAGDDPRLDARVIEELVRLLEETGDGHGAAAARVTRIRYERVPSVRAMEERRLAAELEGASDPRGAVEALERARAIEPLDDLSLGTLDRLLATLGRDDERLGLWTAEATRAPEGGRAARAYVRAAAIADDALGRPDDALRMLRAAWATRPGDEDALDAQVRILSRGEARDPARIGAAIDLLIHAAELAADVALRVSHLEKAAALAEETDPTRAATLYERVLALSPTRRFAIVSLQRALRRAGDHAALARLLEREAEQTTDVDHALALRLRAAEVFHRHARDVERAVAMLRRVLDVRPDHEGALLALLACHEETGRAEDARDILQRLVELRPEGRVQLLLAIAEVSLRRLGDVDGAIGALRKILAEVPAHEVALHDLARTLRRAGAWPEAAEITERVDPLLAAEIWEGRARDDARALSLYRVALAHDPADASAREGVIRLASRRGAAGRANEQLALEAELDPRAQAELALHLGDLPAAIERLAPLAGTDAARTRLEAAWRTADGELARAALDALATEDPRARVRVALARLYGSNAVADARAVIALRLGDPAALGVLLGAPEDAPSALAATLANEREPSCRWVTHLRLSRALPLRGDDAGALAHARAALALDPDSPSAIDATIRLASKVGDREAFLHAQRRAAEIALDPRERVRHLLIAASTARELGRDDATELLDAALAVDPESTEAATAATQHLIGADPQQLARLLHRAAFAATHPERVVALSREAAALCDALGEVDRAIALLGRARALDPKNVAVLVELGDALRRQLAWGESARVLEEAVSHGSESAHREWLARAHRALADLFEGPLADPLRALVALRAVVRLAPDDIAAQRRLAAALARQGQPIEADQVLSALAAHPSVPLPERLAILSQLSEVRLAQRDRTGAEAALRERLKLDPDWKGESFRALSGFHREHLRGDESLADTLAELVVDARADASWLMGLADLELHLGRERAAIMHLKMAAKMVPDDVTALLALAGAQMAIAEHDEAARLLHALAMRDPVHPDVLAAKERALLGTSAREEALVVAELRAWLGQGEEPQRFRARRSLPHPPREGVLVDPAVAERVLPEGASRPAAEVLRLVARSLPKVAPVKPLASYGLGARDRITAKSGHPLRALVDRTCAALGVEKTEVFVREAREGAVEIEPHDPPSLIVPSHALALPEIEIVFAVSRALARYALGAHAFDKLGSRGAATAIAAAVAPFGGTLPVVDGEDLERRLGKAIDRVSRRSLESLARKVAPFDPEAFARAIEQGAVRVAYLLTGDLGSALTSVRRVERIHVADVGRPGTTTGDLMRFALGDDAIALRRRLGTVWSDA
ncbi:MAG: tetratricopeptide repeat protein [Deltaproteobacteria bacterium]|nr:tetratricopeptide repeat protein [Deltaproteobacteria bacterium]